MRDLADYLINSTDMLDKNATILDIVLETLDVEQHSLGILFVLVSKFNTMTVRTNDWHGHPEDESCVLFCSGDTG